MFFLHKNAWINALECFEHKNDGLEGLQTMIGCFGRTCRRVSLLHPVIFREVIIAFPSEPSGKLGASSDIHGIQET